MKASKCTEQGKKRTANNTVECKYGAPKEGVQHGESGGGSNMLLVEKATQLRERLQHVARAIYGAYSNEELAMFRKDCEQDPELCRMYTQASKEWEISERIARKMQTKLDGSLKTSEEE